MSLDPLNICPQGSKPRVNILVPAVDLLDVLDGAGTVGRQGGNKQRYPGSDIRRCHGNTP